MAEQRLVKLLKTGYPHFKEYGGLPSWLLPERSFAIVADGFGDSNILEMAQPLGLPSGMDLISRTLNTDTDKSADGWSTAAVCWPLLPVVKPIAVSLFEASDRIISQIRRGELKTDPSVVWRILLVMGFAPFDPQGRDILEKIATILGGDVTLPAELITRFADAVLSGDDEAITRVDDCINRQHPWQRWTEKMQEQALNFTGEYKLVAVTPPLSDRLACALAEMMKEATDAGA
jgi:hypothetical protein